ncbi:acetyl-CoA carboxylase [Flavobacterium rivuli WB 3.3-2 = DSM 21788]|uniref:Acetyl-CoA carboxylase n=1 Tax=Flavobacterium rivuli WB 3.3-2 = DSM 21788 TaxID=1121895 RepID=A0A0A2LWI8_9FLAO|nr:glycoside hydrolase family 127 protein [Flavobacterium rivuli]KGO84707.1 acetyl-CoA carboxylase [Flavobacterium rivuli WB 3.3-2 = DSM 21788]
MIKNIWGIVSLTLITTTLSIAQTSQLKSFALSDVRLTDSQFKKAQQTDMGYILDMDMDKLLAPYYTEAGLTPKKESYGNWENSGLNGHIGGHYLSALADMYAATGNPELLRRLNYMVDALEECQNANGDGYIGGVPRGKVFWKNISEGKVEAMNGQWVPFYNIHKVYAGLIDAYRVAGIPKAKVLLIKYADWLDNLTAKLSDDQLQIILRDEHGGMNESLAEVAEITGDKKYMVLAKRFSHRAILNPLLHKKDSLTGLHANTQIPKVIGFMEIAQAEQNAEWAGAADFFWNTVTHNRSVSFGGNSVREHFNPSDNFETMIEDREGPETCNSYNMLKLTKQLFLANPKGAYMDYYERTLYNHILSSQNPDGGFVYFTPIRPRHYRVYSQAQEGMWCCVGSGMENHGKYGEMIYAHSDNALYVNLYIPSTLYWNDMGAVVEQKTDFPYKNSSEIKFKLKKPTKFAVHLRYPSWVKPGELKVLVNGRQRKSITIKDSYVIVEANWRNDDVIKVVLPMETKAEQLPDNSQFVSFVHGPIVLAAATGMSEMEGLLADDSRMGHIAHGPLYPMNEAPLIVSADKDLAPLVKTNDLSKLSFNISDVTYQDKYKNLNLVPFNTLHNTRYVIYWPFTTPDGLVKMQADVKAKEEAALKLDQITVDKVTAGEQQPESDHGYKFENSDKGIYKDRHFRSARGWFSYDLKNSSATAKTLRVTYTVARNNTNFEIFINDTLLTTVDLKDKKQGDFFDIEYTLPATLKNPNIINVKFTAKPNSQTANIYDVRLLQ